MFWLWVAYYGSFEKFMDSKTSTRFSQEKAARLAELVKDNQGNLFPGKKAFKNAAQTVERTWQEIKNTLDTEFAEEHHHTKEQIQAKFHNMKMKTKENVAAQNKYMSQTGGGPPSSSSGAGWMETMESAFGSSAAFKGVPGGVETSVLTESVPNDPNLTSYSKRPACAAGNVRKRQKVESSTGDLQRQVLEKELKNANKQSHVLNNFNRVLGMALPLAKQQLQNAELYDEDVFSDKFSELSTSSNSEEQQ